MIKQELKQYDEEFNKQLAEFLKDTRLKKKTNITELCAKIGISYPAYMKYEKGERGIPISIVRKICADNRTDFIKLIKKIDSDIKIDLEDTGSLGE